MCDIVHEKIDVFFFTYRVINALLYVFYKEKNYMSYRIYDRETFENTKRELARKSIVIPFS